MTTFSASGGTRFTDTDGGVSFTAGYAAVPTSGSDATARDIYRPAIVLSPATVTAFGGSMVNGVSVTIAALASVPTGNDLLIWNGTPGGAPNGSYTHAGSGVFNYSARQYLNATSVANGCGVVESIDFYTTGSAADSSMWKLATANGTDWGLVAIGGFALEASLNLSQYALEVDGYLRAEYLVAVSAVDGSATTFQPIHRSDDTPATGIVPVNYDTLSSPVNVADNIGLLVVTPTPDFTDGPEDYGKVYRITSVGTPWEEITPETANTPIFIGAANDVGAPQWWCYRDVGPKAVAISATHVRLERDTAVGVSPTINPWRDLHEALGALAEGIEWVTVDAGLDYEFTGSLGSPSEPTLVQPNIHVVAVDAITVKLPDLANFIDGRALRVSVDSTVVGTVSVTDSDDVEVVELSPGAFVELYSDGGTEWRVFGAPSPGGTSLSDATPQALGTAAAGTGTSASRSDHVHAAPEVLANVATARILGRTSSGSGDSEELTASAVRDFLGQSWVTIADETLGSDTASKQYDVTGYTRVQVLFAGRSVRSGTTDNIMLTLNNDTTSVYSTDAGALTTSLTIGTIPGATTNTDRHGMCEAELTLTSGYLKAGWSRTTNIVSTAAVGAAIVHRGLFCTLTAAITSVEVKAALANMAAGSRITVLGLV